jgi:hypothetical protein
MADDKKKEYVPASVLRRKDSVELIGPAGRKWVRKGMVDRARAEGYMTVEEYQKMLKQKEKEAPVKPKTTATKEEFKELSSSKE